MLSVGFLESSSELIRRVENLDLEGTDWAKKFNYEPTLSQAQIASLVCQELKRPGILFPNIEGITENIHEANEILKSIETFDFAGGDTADDRESIHQSLISSVENLVNNVGSWASIFALLRDDDPSGDARQHLGEIEALVEAARAQKREAEEAAEGARVAAQRSGAAVFTEAFETETGRTNKLGYVWTALAGSLTALTGVAMYLMVYKWPPVLTGDDLSVAVSGALFRLVVLSLFAFGIRWCSRAALANFHLSTVYRHRALCVQTLQAFQKSPANSAAQDAVVLEGARSAFEHVPTGYLPGRSSGSVDSPRMIDALRSLNSRAE